MFFGVVVFGDWNLLCDEGGKGEYGAKRDCGECGGGD